jgi:hypothetical protein
MSLFLISELAPHARKISRRNTNLTMGDQAGILHILFGFSSRSSSLFFKRASLSSLCAQRNFLFVKRIFLTFLKIVLKISYKNFARKNGRPPSVIELGPRRDGFMGPENLRDQVLVVRELQGLFLSVNKFIFQMEAAEN